MSNLVGAVDAGGTTFKCAIIKPGNEPLAYHRIQTTTPIKTLSEVTNWFDKQIIMGNKITRLGVASFGPVDRDPISSHYGTILNTPKPGWSGFKVRQYLENKLAMPVDFESDVNAALLAERKMGACKGVASCAFLSVGTGIGAAFYSNNERLGIPAHPEFGHIRVQRHPLDDYEGNCSFHMDCLEGLASAKALTERFGDTTKLDEDHIAWDVASFYLAQACVVISLTLRPTKIVVGGGLLEAPFLLTKIRKTYLKLQNGYLSESPSDTVNTLVGSHFGENAGIYGAALLTQ